MSRQFFLFVFQAAQIGVSICSIGFYKGVSGWKVSLEARFLFDSSADGLLHSMWDTIWKAIAPDTFF